MWSKRWFIGQAAVSAGVAWFIARDLLGHESPFFAPIAAVVGLGTSYGQRWRRITEITAGVAVGVLIADLIARQIGSGPVQLAVIVAMALSAALLLNAGGLFVTQAAVQSIIITALLPSPGEAFVRFTDALVGGGVALVAATAVPRAALRQPATQAAAVLTRIAELLRGAATGLATGEIDEAMDLLSKARASDQTVRDLQLAADEGLSIVRSSPFRVRHRATLLTVSELIEPLDLALRNTRVVVRRVAVAAYRHDTVPPSYAALLLDIARVVDDLAAEVTGDCQLLRHRQRLHELASATAIIEASNGLSAQVILGEMRSLLSDLLRLTGLDPLEATDAIPPIRLD